MGHLIQSLPHNAGRGVQTRQYLYSFSLHDYILPFFLAEVKTNFKNQEILVQLTKVCFQLFRRFVNTQNRTFLNLVFPKKYFCQSNQYLK